VADLDTNSVRSPAGPCKCGRDSTGLRGHAREMVHVRVEKRPERRISKLFAIVVYRATSEISDLWTRGPGPR
jgi:hypothetical protein